VSKEHDWQRKDTRLDFNIVRIKGASSDRPHSHRMIPATNKRVVFPRFNLPPFGVNAVESDGARA
jgi:hypothetical protein